MLDVEDCMHWQSVGDLEVEKRERAKYDKKLRRADHIQRWQQERKRKVRPKMERAALMSKPREPRRNSAMQTFTYYDVLPTSHGEVAGRI